MTTKPEEFFKINHLPPYGLGEIARAVIGARAAGDDIIDLSQFNPDLPPPPAAIDRLVQSTLQPHNHRYSSSQGITRLRTALTELYRRRFGVELDPENEVVVTMGIKEGLSHLLFSVLSPGDGVLLPIPSYPIHNAAVILAGGRVIGVPFWIPEQGDGGGRVATPSRLTENDDWFFRRVALAWERTWPRPQLMIVSFPHNPTTCVVTAGFFARLVELAREKGFFIVHDHAYADLAFEPGAAPSILAAPGATQVAVECYSLSKGLSLAGWRVGFCAGNPMLVAALKKIKGYLDCGIFQPLQIAAARVLDQHESLIAENVESYKIRRNVMCDGLERLGWEVTRPEGSVFVWARLPEHLGACGSLPFARALLAEARVAVCPGTGFDARAERYVRFALTDSEKRLRAAVERIGQLDPASIAGHAERRGEAAGEHPYAAAGLDPALLEAEALAHGDPLFGRTPSSLERGGQPLSRAPIREAADADAAETYHAPGLGALSSFFRSFV